MVHSRNEWKMDSSHKMTDHGCQDMGIHVVVWWFQFDNQHYFKVHMMCKVKYNVGAECLIVLRRKLMFPK
jgi:hypothetical protein